MPLQHSATEIEVQYAEKVRLLEAFHQIGRAMLFSMDRDTILDTMSREIVKAGILRSLMVALVDNPGREIRVVRGYLRTQDGEIRDRTEDYEGVKYSLDDDNITAVVARTGKIQVIEGFDDRLDNRFDWDRTKATGKISYFIPVSREDRVCAVLATGSRYDEEQETLRRIDSMAPLLDHFVIALNHVRQYEEIQTYSRRLAQSHDDLGNQISVREKEERELELFYELSLDMMCIAGFDGYFRYLNPSWSRTLGYTEEELKSKPLIEFVHPDDRDKTISEAARLAGGMT